MRIAKVDLDMLSVTGKAEVALVADSNSILEYLSRDKHAQNRIKDVYMKSHPRA